MSEERKYKSSFVVVAIVLTLAMLATMLFVLYPLSKRVSKLPDETSLGVIGELPPFSLVSHSGSEVSEKSVEGQVTVIGFFFTKCEGICPALTSAMKRLDSKFTNTNRLKLLQISVDPTNDTVERLKEFAAENGVSGDRWVLLTGQKGQAVSFAREGLKLGATEVPGDILHSDRFVLVDAKGLIRGYYRPLEEDDFDRLVNDIQALVKEAEAL
ncbi:MAG: SCO family protein [Fimbriimonadales bacterium]|nr:SCO family protein [Fimbriimonadales bacterium]